MFKFIATLLIGSALLAAALVNVLSTRQFLSESMVVPGKVTALNAGGSHPQITFVTRKGETISYPQGGFIYGMKVGQEVSVRYEEGRPLRSATLDVFGAIWATALSLAIIGGGAVLTALTNLPSRNKKQDN